MMRCRFLLMVRSSPYSRSLCFDCRILASSSPSRLVLTAASRRTSHIRPLIPASMTGIKASSIVNQVGIKYPLHQLLGPRDDDGVVTTAVPRLRDGDVDKVPALVKVNCHSLSNGDDMLIEPPHRRSQRHCSG